MFSPPGSLSRGFAALLDVAFPPACPACGGSEVRGSGFCAGCDTDLERFAGAVCPRCSLPCPVELPPPAEASADDCPACRDQRWAFDRVVSLGPYTGLLRRLVLEGKRRRGESACVGLGRLLGERLAPEEQAGAVLVPVPQHWTRRIARRADGVAALAAGLSAATGMSVQRRLTRIRPTPRQTEVAPSSRAANVRSAFATNRSRPLAGERVLLVDDVFTTGATCQAAAQTLRRAGACRVTAVVAARRVGPG